MTKTLVLMGMALAGLAGCASVSQDVAGVLEFTHADLNAAAMIAQANGDVAAMNCTNALLAALPADSAGLVGITPQGPLSAYVKARGLLRAVDRGLDESIHIACAPLVLDLEKRIVKVGVSVLPGGGIAGKLLGK